MFSRYIPQMMVEFVDDDIRVVEVFLLGNVASADSSSSIIVIPSNSSRNVLTATLKSPIGRKV